MRVSEGTIAVPGGDVYYKTVGPSVSEGLGRAAVHGSGQGDGPGLPLLAIHGGPGMAHDYLDPLEDLADRRTVVFWDQLGCGRSDRPEDPTLWSVGRSVAEVEAVREAVGLEEFHLFGNSWGGWLALQYVLDRRPKGLVSLTLSSSPPSVPRTVRDMTELKRRLPEDVQAVIEDHERREAFDCPEYVAAIMVFYKRHLCRLERWPPGVEYALGAGFGGEIYRTMWGPAEFGPVTEVLRDWDVTKRLAEIEVPTLITGGRHDEMWPEHLAVERDGIRGSELVIFEDSSHRAFVEEREAYMAVMNRFLDGVEGAR